ncbi:MAG: HipA domain-containing protein [Myxococcaceae bacterium]|nr:HipA domain-containing protein [Myxococcaceae bacterium]
MQPVPLFIVREDASVDELGLWHHEARTLELVAKGFPFLGPGRHVIEGTLPWLFWEMFPSGFLGARFRRAFPELRLTDARWPTDAGECLRALSQRGEDLPGNVLVGAETKGRFERDYLPALLAGRLKRDDVARVIDESLDANGPGTSSSVGGERPKVLLHDVGESRSEMLLKFTPPLDTPLGIRWKNLLRFEALCGETLRHHGIAAVATRASFQFLPWAPRAGLLMRRYDRVPVGGRRGTATLWALATERGLGDAAAPTVLHALHADGLVTAADAALVERVHRFSAAIGNTDAHLGNYGLLFDASGAAAVAPFFDISPMVFAPRADELPDVRLTPRTEPIPTDVAPLVATLDSLVSEDDVIDADFREAWRRHVGC